jgi:PAS domain S-box-containing protein
MAEASLQTDFDGSARRYFEFINSLPAAVFRKTLEGKIVFCNRGYARILGFDTPEELIGYPVINLYRNKKDRGILVDAVIQTGGVTDLPVALTKKDGVPIWCALTARAVLDDDGIVVHLDGVLKDITAEIEEKQENHSNSDKFQGVLEMAGGVVHRLNQPLTIVNNVLNELINDSQTEDPNYQKIMTVHNQVKKMNEITKKIGNIKKYEAMEYVAGIKIVDIDKAS